MPDELDIPIPAGLTDDELAARFVNRLNAWENVGADSKAIHDEVLHRIGTNQRVDDYTDEILAQYSPYFEDALFVPGWDDGTHQGVQNLAIGIAGTGAWVLYYNIATQGASYPDDIESFRWTSTLEAVRLVPSDAADRVLELDIWDSDNRDMNRVGEAVEADEILNPRYTLTVYFNTIDGFERVTSVSATLGP